MKSGLLRFGQSWDIIVGLLADRSVRDCQKRARLLEITEVMPEWNSCEIDKLKYAISSFGY